MNEIRKPGGLVQRCVIIHKDENGFGLTVSGDNPVYVQSVKENGAAANAGVQVDDQIIKVNGTVVSQADHPEVVKHIRSSGSYVALTLLGKDNNPRPESPHHKGHKRSRSLGNNLVPSKEPKDQNDSKSSEDGRLPRNNSSGAKISTTTDSRVVEIERMLNQEREYHKKILEEYMRAPSVESQQKLAESQTRINAHEKQLKILTGHTPTKSSFGQSARQAFRPSVDSLWSRNQATRSQTSFSLHHSSVGAPSVEESQNKLHPREGIENIHPAQSAIVKHPPPSASLRDTSKLQASLSSPNIEDSMASPTQQESPLPPLPVVTSPKPPVNFDSLFAQVQQDNLMATTPTHTAASVIAMEEDEFEEEAQVTDHGPFISLDKLSHHPAHLAVFLHFLMSNDTPDALFFWLVADVYREETSGNTKDLKRWIYEIYSTFIARNAPLKVDVVEYEEIAIEETLGDPKASEERLHSVFDVARQIVMSKVNRQLETFRNQRVMGLSGMFGDHQLEDELDRNKELKVIEQTLLPHLDSLMADVESQSDIQNDRNSAMASALATFIKQSGIHGKTSSRSANVLERCRTFAEKEKSSFGVFRGKRKTHTVNGHQFVSTQYTNLTLCKLCEKLLWGIGTQGYQCQVCEYNVHKRPCADNLTENCASAKLKIKPNNKDHKKPPIKSPKPTEVRSLDSEDTLDLPEQGRSRFNSSPNLSQTELLAQESEDQFDTERDGPERPLTPFEESQLLRKNKANTVHQRKTQTNIRNILRTESLKAPNLYRTQKVAGSLPGIKQDGFSSPTPSSHNNKPPPDSPPPEIDSDEEPDSDLEVETEVPNWQDVADKKLLKRLKDKDIKRQEVIHELIHTEKTHVRNLKVLYKVFYKPLLRNNILQENQIKEIFPNIEELVEIHVSLLETMKKRVRSSDTVETIGDLMLDRFGGVNGEHVKEACAKFCQNQKAALENLKKLKETKKDLLTFMCKQETHRWCRRLKFTDILASTHQRLVKYPLLLESINKATPPPHRDYQSVEKSVKCCKTILNYVNAEIEEAQNLLRLEELSRQIEDTRKASDSSQPIGKLDITTHKLIYEGDLFWKMSNTKTINLHVVLLNNLLLLLKKDDDDKYILKMHNVNMGTSVKIHSPVIQVTNIITREVATDQKAFFLMIAFTGTPQIYELIAPSVTAKKIWVKYIAKQVKENKLEQAKEKPETTGRTNGLIAVSPSIPEEAPATTTTGVSGDEKSPPVSPPQSPTPEDIKARERLTELTEDLQTKDREIKALLAEKLKVIEEIKNLKLSELYEQGSRSMLVSAIEQVTRLTTSVNEVLSATKDSTSENQQQTITDSVTSLSDILSNILISTEEIENPIRDSEVEEEKSSLENSGAHSEQQYEESDEKSISRNSSFTDSAFGSITSRSSVSSNASTATLMNETKDDGGSLVTSPFTIFSKRPSADKIFVPDSLRQNSDAE